MSYTIKNLYDILDGSHLMPSSTTFTWWDSVYNSASADRYDREFTRLYKDFKYYDFSESTNATNALASFRADVLSILEMNQKKYAELYRIHIIADNDMPITYNYDMTETTGEQVTTDVYGQRTDTKGEQIDINGTVTDSHNVAPFNSTSTQAESEDVRSSQTLTEGERSDVIGTHTDTHTNDSWTLTRKGNIGVQTGADIARVFNDFWINHYKFMKEIFNDICTQLLYIED